MQKSDRAGQKPWLIAAVFLAWLVSYFAARAFLKQAEMVAWQRVTIALFPVPFFALFLVLFIRSIRHLDELQIRIHLEALAFAYPLAMLLLMTLALMQRAIDLPFEDWSYAHVWIYLPLFYFFGMAIAARRYR